VLRGIAWALSGLVVVGWVVLVVYTIVASVRMEPGWSMAPANVVLDTILAAMALGAVWGVVLGLERIGQLNRELQPPKQ
jgi:hypothetical protein